MGFRAPVMIRIMTQRIPQEMYGGRAVILPAKHFVIVNMTALHIAKHHMKILRSHHMPRYDLLFFEECEWVKGCQNDPDLLSRSTSKKSCQCPDCLCGSGKQSG
eukprot:633930_1